MSAPVFATKWEFLFAQVLIGVDRASGQFFGVDDGQGHPLVSVWTDQDLAVATLPPSHDLRRTPAYAIVGMLPDGIGLSIDTGSPGAMLVEPAYAASLRPLAVPFPPGTQLAFKPWEDLPAATTEAISAELAGREFVQGAWALLYTIDDSPYLGCLVVDGAGGPEGVDAAFNGVQRALDESASLSELDVAGVKIVTREDLPPDVLASDLLDRTVIYRA